MKDLMNGGESDVLVHATVAGDVVGVEQLVVVGNFAALEVGRNRVAGNGVGIGLHDARSRRSRVPVGVVHRPRGRVVSDVVEEGVIDAQCAGCRDAETAVRARVAFDHHVIDGIGDAVRSYAGDELGKSVGAGDEFPVRVRAQQWNVERVVIAQLNAQHLRGLELDVSPRRHRLAVAVEQKPGRDGVSGRIQRVFAKKNLLRGLGAVRLVLIDERCGLILVIVDVVRRIGWGAVVVRDGAGARHGHEIRERIVERALDQVGPDVVCGACDVVGATLIERIVVLQQDTDGAVAAFLYEVEAVIEELAEHDEPRVEWSGQAHVGRDIGNQVRLRVVGVPKMPSRPGLVMSSAPGVA